jgi:hypothetical protein
MKSMKEKIAQYVQLRDYKTAAKKEFEKGLERVTEAMKKLEGEFLTELLESEQESARTAAGTIYRLKRSSCSVKDRDEFFQWATSTENVDAMDIKANKTAVRKLLGKGVVVPGVNFSEIIQVGIRRGDEE